MTVLAAKHLITASELTQMCGAGVFREDDRLELIEGEIIEMSPIGKRHATAVRRLNNLLTRRPQLLPQLRLRVKALVG